MALGSLDGAVRQFRQLRHRDEPAAVVPDETPVAEEHEEEAPKPTRKRRSKKG